MIRVVVVDDQALIRSAVAQLLTAEPDIEIVGEADDGATAVSLVRATLPDVVVMDIRMPVLDGIGATTQICADAALDATKVLVLTTFEEDEYVVSALRAGASGFIGKGSDPQEIARAVRAIHAGDALLSPAATRGLIGRYLDRGASATHQGVRTGPSTSLTPREAEILVLVAQGLSNDEIAANLFISTHTAKTHVKRIMGKIGAHDRAQCVIHAYETRLLRPADD